MRERIQRQTCSAPVVEPVIFFFCCRSSTFFWFEFCYCRRCCLRLPPLVPSHSVSMCIFCRRFFFLFSFLQLQHSFFVFIHNIKPECSRNKWKQIQLLFMEICASSFFIVVCIFLLVRSRSLYFSCAFIFVIQFVFIFCLFFCDFK